MSTVTATASITLKPNALLLQQEKTRKLQAELDAINSDYFQNSQRRNRVDVKNFEAFYRHQQNLFIDSLHKEVELNRSKRMEAVIKEALAGQVAAVAGVVVGNEGF